MRNWLGPVLRCTSASVLVGVAAAPVAAQTANAGVVLSVVVPPQASVEQVSGPFARTLDDGGTEYVARVVIRSNAPYRLIARRAADGPPLTLGTKAASNPVAMSLTVDRRAAVVARGQAGVSAFDVTIDPATAATMAGSEAAVRFFAIPDESVEPLGAPEHSLRLGPDAETPPQRRVRR
jgi:hypothetical protein